MRKADSSRGTYRSAAVSCYDALTGDHQRALLAYLGRIRPIEQTVLDVGCGTGKLLESLVRAGWIGSGVDRSVAMVRAARHRCPGIRIVVGDARKFSVPAPVGLVTATFDVVNHIGSDGGLAAFIRCARKALLPGGTLVFDSVTPHDIDRNWGSYVDYTSQKHWRLARFGRRIGPCVGEIRYELFCRARDGGWELHEERHRLRAWPRLTLERALLDAGFVRTKFVDAGTLSRPGRSCGRWLITAVRSRDI